VIQKKICLLGGFGVGKTSLVSRYVHSIFSDKYLTTLGVKIEKKAVTVEDKSVELIIWDLHGEDEFQKVNMSYLRGASGYLLVADGTRRHSIDTALMLNEAARRSIGKVPFILVVNKVDLADSWEIDPTALERFGVPVVRTSAKSGEHVEDTFAALARAMST
jgi:small GTP-binding protein